MVARTRWNNKEWSVIADYIKRGMEERYPEGNWAVILIVAGGFSTRSDLVAEFNLGRMLFLVTCNKKS